jgi:hypothetical protein
MAILVDDAHWADRPSLRPLAYLADRPSLRLLAYLADRPSLRLLAYLAERSGQSSCEEQALGALRRAASDTTLRPDSFSPDGVGEVVRAEFPHAKAAFCHACAAVTNGNPFLLTELLAQLKSDDWPPTAASAQRLASSPPGSVMRAVLAHLETRPAETALVTRAVAVWGAEATTGLDRAADRARPRDGDARDRCPQCGSPAVSRHAPGLRAPAHRRRGAPWDLAAVLAQRAADELAASEARKPRLLLSGLGSRTPRSDGWPTSPRVA